MISFNENLSFPEISVANILLEDSLAEFLLKEHLVELFAGILDSVAIVGVNGKAHGGSDCTVSNLVKISIAIREALKSWLILV